MRLFFAIANIAIRLITHTILDKSSSFPKLGSMGRLLLSLLSYLALCFCAQNVSADIVLEYFSGGSFASNFDTVVGSTVTVEVFVSESGANNELSSDGLIAFGTVGNYAPTSGLGGSVTSNAVIDPAFTNVIDDSTSATVVNMAALDTDPGDGFPSGTSIRLGEFDVLISGVGVTRFDFSDYRPAAGFSDFATPSGVDLDPIIFADGRSHSFTITATAVPEPTLFALVKLMGLTLLFRRRRKQF